MTFDVGDCQKLPYPMNHSTSCHQFWGLYLRLIITLLPTNLDAFVGQEDASAWQAGAQAAKLKRITESQLVSVHHPLRVSVHHLPGPDPPITKKCPGKGLRLHFLRESPH